MELGFFLPFSVSQLNSKSLSNARQAGHAIPVYLPLKGHCHTSTSTKYWQDREEMDVRGMHLSD